MFHCTRVNAEKGDEKLKRGNKSGRTMHHNEGVHKKQRTAEMHVVSRSVQPCLHLFSGGGDEVSTPKKPLSNQKTFCSALHYGRRPLNRVCSLYRGRLKESFCFYL